jgi:WD40 repeat protein
MAFEETTVGDDAQVKEDTGRDLSIWRLKLHLDGHSGGANAFAFSNDRELLASASEDGTVRLWNTTTKKRIRKLKSSDPITAVVFSPDGQLVASASEDNTVRLWNPIIGEQLFNLEGHSDAVRAVAFSPDGQLLASASDDKTVRLWDSFTGENLQVLKEHSHPVDGVAFSPDGALLASASGDRTIILWTEEAEETLRMSNSYLIYYHVTSSLIKLYSLGLSCFYKFYHGT